MSQDTIDAGANLLAALKTAGTPPSAALWLYMPEPDRWKLVLVPPDIETAGPKQAYERIQSILSKAVGAASIIDLTDIVVLEPHDRRITLLRRAIRVRGGAGVRFTDNVIDGTLIEDAYIYTL